MFRRDTKLALDKYSATPVRKRPSLDFSLTGLIYCSMMMFLGLAAINSQANLLFGVFGLMIGILIVSGVVSRVVLRKLSVVRSLPEQSSVGTPTTIIYDFRNSKRFWPSLSVALGELDGAEAFTKQPCAYMLHTAAGTDATVPIEVTPKRRGLHALERYQLGTSFPFGFIKRATVREHRDSFLVSPAIGRVDQRVLQMCRSAETSGAMMRPRRGGQDEFYGVKEHRPGESLRWVYWRRSARTPGVLVAKEMTQVSPPKLLLMVDTRLRERTVDDHVLIEKTIAMAASLASHALEQGLSVGLYTWSDGWMGIAPNRGKRHRRDLLAALARLPLNEQHDPQALLDRAEEFVKVGTTPVLLTPRDIQLGLGDHLRSGMLVISAASQQAERWFKFEKTVDFARCMPPEQQPRMRSNE